MAEMNVGCEVCHLPHPQVGKTWLPSEDWTKWYPTHVIIPGVQPEDRIDTVYTGDLAGMFKLDEPSKATGIYDAGKYHQQYQEYLQSGHYTTAKEKDKLSCFLLPRRARRRRQAEVGRREGHLQGLPRCQLHHREVHARRRADRERAVRAHAHLQQEAGATAANYRQGRARLQQAACARRTSPPSTVASALDPASQLNR
jgi:hypothetical protein